MYQLIQGKRRKQKIDWKKQIADKGRTRKDIAGSGRVWALTQGKKNPAKDQHHDGL